MTKEGDIPYGHTSPARIWLTAKDRARERRAAVAFLVLTVFLVGAPSAVDLMEEGRLSWTSAAAALPWIFNIWLFGWRRMLCAFVLLWAHTREKAPIDPLLGQGFLWDNRFDTLPEGALFSVSLADGRPQPMVHLPGVPAFHAHPPHGAAESWAFGVSGGDTWSLLFRREHVRIDPHVSTSAHAKMAAVAAWNRAQEASQTAKVTPDRWNEALARLFPGKLPA